MTAETTVTAQADDRLEAAVVAAAETQCVWIAPGAVDGAGEYFRELFPGAADAVVVCDETTRAVAGELTERALRGAGVMVRGAHVFLDRPGGRRLHADYEHAAWLRDRLAAHGAVPVAVGAGTINDLTKLAAHLAGQPYMWVATAASMDGYAAYGAAITRGGFKQTLACPAPRGLVGDTAILARAPAAMTAAGFGDLAGKIPAGADWLLADAAGAEPLDARIWELVQPAVRDALGASEEIARRDAAAVARLFRSLVLSGLAMQAARSSRPASGAEHQLSHLWEMRGVQIDGEEVPHGFKVGVGTLLVAVLYERLLETELAGLDVAARVAAWPAQEEQLATAEVDHHAAAPEMREQVLAEVRAKYVGGDALGERLRRLKAGWPALRDFVRRQLLPADEMRRRLAAVGCPTEPEQIGLTREEALDALRVARQIRRRYTVLDLAAEVGLMEME